MRLDKVGYKGVRVGVALPDYDLNGKIGRDKRSWAIHSNGKVYHDNQDRPYTEKMPKRSVVELELDRDDGTIKFFVNGSDQGVAFTSPDFMDMELFPAVRVSEGSKLTLLD